MKTETSLSEKLSGIYSKRFEGKMAYRKAVWNILIAYFRKQYIPTCTSILDLGAGYGEFINGIPSQHKYAMDLNPDTGKYLEASVHFIQQDCSQPWRLPESSLDVVFTSNFFEHLPDKSTLEKTIIQIQRALKPGGRLIAMGPNIRCIPGAYWDFWDHYLPLTEKSLAEGLTLNGFSIVDSFPYFLPYTMTGSFQFPLVCISAYLHTRIAWPVFGKQFLVVAESQRAPKL